jgi:putative DNA primase/helicase
MTDLNTPEDARRSSSLDTARADAQGAHELKPRRVPKARGPRCPFERARVERHVRLIHDAARGVAGFIVVGVGRCDPDLDKKTFRSYRARVGDVDKTLEQVMDQDGVPNANVWIGLFVVGLDAPRGSRGNAGTCAAVLGLVADLDHDKGDKSASTFPFDDPTYVVETSPGNEQPALIFDNPMAYADAKRLAERLSACVGGDAATGDPVHVWRLDGTANWPDRKKIERGRPREPHPVRIIRENFERRFRSEEIGRTLDLPALSVRRSTEPDGPPQSWQNQEPVDLDELRRASALIIASDLSRDAWVRVGAAHHYCDLWPEFLALSRRYTRHGAKKNEDDARKLWASFKRDSGSLAGAVTIFEYARRNVAYGGRSKHDGHTATMPSGRRKKTGEFAPWDGREPDSYNWLWPYWLGRGELHLIAGAIGAGKTTIALSIAATVTSGAEWPDGNKCEKGVVVFWSGEDSVEKALMPRFMAMGGDCSRIGGISVVDENSKERSFDPTADLDLLRDVLEDWRRRGEPVSLIVIDPFIVIAKTDSHKNAETRRDMQPLTDLAREFDAAVLGVTHYTKGTQRQAVNERVTGSLAFGAQARAIFAAVVHDDKAGAGNSTHSFIRTKSNFGPSGGGFAYDIETTQIVSGVKIIECTALKWGGQFDGSAQRLVDEAEGGKRESALADAVSFLIFALADGPRPADGEDGVKAEATANIISPMTLRRAREQIGVVIEKEKVARGRWMWSLPPETTVKRAAQAEGAHPSTRLTELDHLDHLSRPEIARGSERQRLWRG